MFLLLGAAVAVLPLETTYTTEQKYAFSRKLGLTALKANSVSEQHTGIILRIV